MAKANPTYGPHDFGRFCADLKLENGKNLKLEGFQRKLLSDYFKGATETVVLIPKKNGKSTLLGALALYHLLRTPDAECVIAAASRDQAEIMLRQARGFINRSPKLAEQMEVRQRQILSRRDDGRIRILAADADTADGVIPTLALVDELHRHKSADLYGVFRDGLGPRDGQLITISTAGDYEDSPLGRIRTAAYAMPGVKRDGAYRYVRSSDGGFALHEWALEASDDLHDVDLVKTANPASWQTVAALRRRHDSVSMTDWQWARFAGGVWVQSEDAAISPVDWAACGDPASEIPAGEHVWLGIDLGWKWDTTAIVPLWLDGDRKVVGKPAIIVPPRDGTSSREEDITGPIYEMADRWHVEAVVLDPNAGGEQLAQRLEDAGLTVISHSQDPAPMSSASERLMAAIRDRSLVHPDDQDLNAHALAAQQKTVAGEKWRFVKPRRGGRHIDALIALAMVLSLATTQAPKRTPTFEVLV